MEVIFKRKHLNFDKTAYAKATALKSSVQKVSLVVDLIKGMRVANALEQLSFSRKKIAKEIKVVLSSAIANAENNFALDPDKLYVSEILIGKAFTLKRFHARGRGRSSKILKPFSNVTIFVSERG